MVCLKRGPIPELPTAAVFTRENFLEVFLIHESNHPMDGYRAFLASAIPATSSACHRPGYALCGWVGSSLQVGHSLVLVRWRSNHLAGSVTSNTSVVSELSCGSTKAWNISHRFFCIKNIPGLLENIFLVSLGLTPGSIE